MFKVQGVYREELLEVSWSDDGFLTGRQDVVALANILANESGTLYGPHGMEKSGADVLKDEHCIFYLLATLLRDIELIGGDLTPLEPRPEDAV